MMAALLASCAALMWAIRLSRVRAMWRLPFRHGEDFFLAQRVGPGFYGEAGAALLRRYRFCLFLPLAIDAPLAVWLAAAAKYALLFFEQWFALILTAVAYSVMLVHFSARATALAGTHEERPATTVQLSMAPRRLRDHSNRWVELAIAACLLISLALLARGHALAAASDSAHAVRAMRRGTALVLWILYMQVGLLLLKGVFVRWRMPLPVRRTEDFCRWRGAWLSYHLKLFDALRVLSALVLLSTMSWLNLRDGWPRIGVVINLGTCALAIPAFILFLVREGRRLALVEREIRPIELVKEFPRPPIPEGRFLAGGLLYFNRDNPGVLVRSAQGIALNLGHTSTYAWTVYLVGLALLMAWMVR